MAQTIPRLHLYHIPRTGGTSIGLFMRKHNRTKQHPKRIGYHVTGHNHYRPYPKEYFTIIGMRDPTHHAASLYKYIQRSKNHKQHKRVISMTLLQYIEYSRDSYLGFLTSKKNRSMNAALENLQSISFVYLTHTLNRDLTLFLKYLGTSLQWSPTRYNTTREINIAAKHIAAVRHNRPLDHAIFEAAKKLNTRQRAYFTNHASSGLIPQCDWSGIVI